MKIDHRSLNEETSFINKYTSNCRNKSDLENFFRSQCAVESVKYPFLSKSQIKSRIMTIWKKKNAPLPRFKGNQGSATNKMTSGSKLEVPKRYKSVKDNYSVEKSHVKFPAKESLNPLKVDIVPNSTIGVLKRNSSKTGEKRRVSFNKELYIRYRSTSEESSGSTLKYKRKNLKANCNPYSTKKNVRSQQDDKFDKLLNKKCSWSYRSPRNKNKCISMEVSKESRHALNNFLDEISQNKDEDVTSNELLEESNDDYWNTSDKTDLKQNGLRNLQRDAHFQNDSDKKETHTKGNNEILNEEYLYENVNKEAQLQFSLSAKKENNVQNIHTVFNESAVSNDSSSDEEILQTRFPVQNEDEASISNKESITENYSETKKPIIIQAKAYDEKEVIDCEFNDSNTKIIKETEKKLHQDVSKNAEKNKNQDIYKKVEENVNQDTSKREGKNKYHSTNEQAKKHERKDIHKQAEKNEQQKYMIDVANSLNVEADNSNIETESSCRQNSIKIKNRDLNFDKTKDRNEISSEEINTEKNENNDISLDAIIKDFFNGSFDISIFKPNKNSTMIEDDKMVRKEKQSIKDGHSPSKERKYRKNMNENTNEKTHSKARRKTQYNDNKHFKDSTDDSMIHLKRKMSENQTENAKKARIMITKENEDEDNIASDNFNKYVLKSKTKSENIYSKSNNQHKRLSSRSKYSNKDIKLLNNFDVKHSNKNNINNTRAKRQKNEELFKGFSNETLPLKKTRNLRNSSLIASKKIKEIEKLENVDSDKEIINDSGSSCYDSNVKKIENSFKNIFKGQNFFSNYKDENKVEKEKFHNEGTIDIFSLNDTRDCLEKEKKLESKTTRTNRKRKNKFEGIFDTCHVTKECQLKMDNISSKEPFIPNINQLSLLVKENEDANGNHQKNKKKAGNERQSKNNQLTKNKSPNYNKKIDKVAPYKDYEMNVDYGVMTRSKKKTWDTLEKELLGESNDASFSNVTRAALLKEKSVVRRNLKEIDLHSVPDKSVMPFSMSIKTSKRGGKYKTQNTEFKHLQTSANKVQSNEIVPYKSKNILAKTIAAMQKCTANFFVSRENLFEKEWINGEAELDDMIDEMSSNQEAELDDIIDEMSSNQEAEFHSNMTFVQKKNEQYYKNKIVAVLKQSSSKKNETLCRRTSGEFKYDFGDAEHVVKKSIITESYSLKSNSEETLKPEDQALIISSHEEQSDPWTRLIKELNLEQSKTENKNKDILIGTPNRKALIYHENVEQYTNVRPNIDTTIQLTMNLKERKKYKQNANEKEEIEQEVANSAFKKNLIQSNEMDICYDLNVQGNYIETIGTEANKDADLNSVSTREKLEKAKIVTKQRRVIQKKKAITSPKYKLQAVHDGGIKFKRCNRSFSSSSEQSVKQKQGNTRKDDRKLLKDEQNSEKQKYRKYLNNLFEGANSHLEKKLEKDERKAKGITKEESHKNNLVKDSDQQRKKIKGLIAKDDDDVFSISSADSEEVNKGSGLLCDLFDE